MRENKYRAEEKIKGADYVTESKTAKHMRKEEKKKYVRLGWVKKKSCSMKLYFNE